MIAVRILDPRLWRRRVAQLAAIVGGLAWVTYRSVDSVDVVRAVRDDRHARRNAELRRRLQERTRRYLEG